MMSNNRGNDEQSRNKKTHWKGDKSERRRLLSLFSLFASPRVIAQSLLICGWPAVTVAPLPAPAVATLHLFHPVQPGIRNNGEACRKCETAFFRPPRYGTLGTLGWMRFFFCIQKSRQRESARTDERTRGRVVTRVTGTEEGENTPPRLR